MTIIILCIKILDKEMHLQVNDTFPSV
uniref:Uncharacterized protein n=1 Tax=Anguilla anguilla TaxID=7936 RepID=A0A0E9S7C7_ANGAN